METLSIGQTLPELYRAVLERVAELEQAGHRDEAFHIRRAALHAYSRAWDQNAQRRLAALSARAERVLGGVERSRPSRTVRSTAGWSGST